MQFVYSPYDYEQMQQYQLQQQRQRQYQQQLQQQAMEEYYQQQIAQQMQQRKLQEQKQQQKLQQQQQQQQQNRQEQAQQLFDYMYMQQLQQQEASRQQELRQQKHAANRAASLEKVRVAEVNRQKALKAAQEADAERQAALEEIARYEQEEAEAKRAEEKRAEEKRVADLKRAEAAKAKAEAEAKAAKAKAEADAKAKAEAEAKQAQLQAAKQAQLQKDAEDKARVAALKQQRLADVQAKKQAQQHSKPMPVQSEAEAFADYYSQLTGCPGNGPSFAQALKQLGVNVNYESDDDTAAEEEPERPTQVDLSEPKHVAPQTTPLSNASTDVEDDEDVQDDNSSVHPLVSFLQSLGIPATISEPQVKHAFNQEDPDLALADFVESLSDDEKPSEASKKASKAAKRAAKAQAAALQAQAEAEAAQKAQDEAEEELQKEKLLKKQKRAAKKAAKKAATKQQAPSTPSKPLPSVVVYSSPQSTEQDTVKQLSKISATVDRSVETYERIKRAATQSDSEYSNSVSSYNSRIKVIQQAQIKLESAYDELDSMTVSTADEKKERTRLIRRAVSTAEAIDPIVEQLKSEKSKIEKTVTSSDEEEIPRKVTNKKNNKSGSPVRKVTLETVPDADSASD